MDHSTTNFKVIRYEFFPSWRTGTNVIQSPLNLIYYRLNKTDINSITVQLVDQNNNPIDNCNETLTVVLHIKRHGSHY